MNPGKNLDLFDIHFSITKGLMYTAHVQNHLISFGFYLQNFSAHNPMEFFYDEW
jgi:hypothetical protein